MKGMVYTGFAQMVAEKWDEDLVDDILDDAGLDGAYTAVGTYPHEQMIALVTALSKRTDVPAGDLVMAFGEYLLGMLHGVHPEFFDENPDLPSFLLAIDKKVHVEVRKLYPDANPPRLECRLDGPVVKVYYESHRPFADLCEGLLKAAIAHYANSHEYVRHPESPHRTSFDVRPR
jgi:hypothetical protein